ncbi:MAG: diaminopimelate decarboxylase [archaeon GBS-70-058]|nr:diaminopimelate decarboxylase [Candidatus Culexarchaeum nevadense]
MNVKSDFFLDYIGKLRDRGVDLNYLAEKYGTPLYFIDGNVVKQNYENLRNAIHEVYDKFLICYAYKANTCIALLKLLNSLGAGAEVVSGGELYAAKLAGVPMDKVVFDGVSKSPGELSYAVFEGVLLINIENIDELYWINKFAEEFNIKVSVGVRVNFDIPTKTHSNISTGARIHKFGLNVENAFKAYSLASKLSHVHVAGIHVHIGSQITDIQPYSMVVDKVLSFCTELKKLLGLELEIIDLGGGFGIPYSIEDSVFPLNDYCKVIEKLEHASKEIFTSQPLLIIEPGRFIVGNAGILLTRVNYVKENYGVKWVLVDAGMNDLIRPALYGAHHPIYNLSSNEDIEIYNVGGPVCESSDVFGFDVKLNRVKRGDLLAIMNAGAYGFSMSSNYNSRPRPAVIMYYDGEVKLVRRRESYADLFSHEIF